MSSLGEIEFPEGQSPRGLVVFFPPATGDDNSQKAEATELRSRGYATLQYWAPYLRRDESGRRPGGPTDLETERKLWETARREVAAFLADAQSEKQIPLQKVAFVGKNLGGTCAAYAAPQGLGGIVVSGSIPELSRFWAKSAHPVAKALRESTTEDKLATYVKEIRTFDLVQNFARLKAPRLAQYGYSDGWIERDHVIHLAQSLGNASEIDWLEDDHAMNSPESVRRRMAFVESCLDWQN